MAVILPTSVLPVVEPFPAVSRPPLASRSFKSERMGQDKGPGDRKFLGGGLMEGRLPGEERAVRMCLKVCAHAYRVRRGRAPRPHWAGSAAGSYSPGRPGSPALWAPSPGEAVELDSLVGWGIAASWPAAVA